MADQNPGTNRFRPVFTKSLYKRISRIMWQMLSVVPWLWWLVSGFWRSGPGSWQGRPRRIFCCCEKRWHCDRFLSTRCSFLLLVIIPPAGRIQVFIIRVMQDNLTNSYIFKTQSLYSHQSKEISKWTKNFIQDRVKIQIKVTLVTCVILVTMVTKHSY